MEGILMFVSVVGIVFGVLQIILFFKMWGMTNDVNKIKNKVQANGYPYDVHPAKIEFALGNTEKAQGMVNREFVCEVYKLYLEISASSMSEESEYAGGFNAIESKYREMFDNASSYIEFGKFSTFDKAKKVFH